MSAARIEELETKLAFLEDAHARLDEVVQAQAARITHLEDLCQRLTSEYRALRDRLPGPDEDAGEVPPHY